MDEQIYYTKTSEETQELGRKIAQNIKPGMVIFLYGDLGAGKTTFAKGIASGLGIESRIISPTFVIIREHEINIKSQKLKVKNTDEKLRILYHVDLYRLKDAKEIDAIGIKEILQNKNAVVIIEWPELIEDEISSKDYKIWFENQEDERRKIRIIKS